MGKTLPEIMLLLAKVMGEVYDGAATSLGSTTVFTDTNNLEPTERFEGGTVWLTSGTYSGEVRRVATFANGEITVDAAFTGAVASAVTYAIADKIFPKYALKQAINWILDTADLLKFDTTLTVDGGDVYTLPTGVSNVKRVEIRTDSTEPYQYDINTKWKEQSGSLVFLPGGEPSNTGAVMRLSYIGKHGAIDETGSNDEINDAIDLNWIIWSAAAYLWRRRLQVIKKDDPTAVEMLNEAKTNEARALVEASRYSMRIMRKDQITARW